MTPTQGEHAQTAPGYEHQRAIMEGERNASLDSYSRVVYLTSAESRLYDAAFTNGWDRHAAQVAALTAAPADADNLRKALQFYADGHHFVMHDETSWDTVSGEPVNFYEDDAGTATVENGSIAKLALAGHPIKFEDEDTPAQPMPRQTACWRMRTLCRALQIGSQKRTVSSVSRFCRAA